MPTAPVYKQQIPVNQDVRPVLDDIRVDPNTYGAGFGVGLASAGKDLMHVAAILKHEEEKVKDIVDVEQDSKVVAKQQQLLDEASKLKLNQWSGRENHYQQQMNAAISEASKGISDPTHRRMFEARHAATFAGFSRSINGMYSSNMDEHAGIQEKGALELQGNNFKSALSTGDMENQSKSLAATVSIKENSLIRQGVEKYSAEWHAAIGDTTSKTVSSSIESLLATNRFNEAENAMKQYAGAITPSDKATLDSRLKERRTTLEVSQQGSALGVSISTRNQPDLIRGNISPSLLEIDKWERDNIAKDPLASSKADAARAQLRLYTVAASEQTRQREADIYNRAKASPDGHSLLTDADQSYLTDLKKTDPRRHQQLVNEINGRQNGVIDDRTVAGSILSKIDAAQTSGDTIALSDALAKITSKRSVLSYETSDYLAKRIATAQAALKNDPSALKETEQNQQIIQSTMLAKGVREESKVDSVTKIGVQLYVADKLRSMPADIKNNSQKQKDYINKNVIDFLKKDRRITTKKMLGSWAVQENVSMADEQAYQSNPGNSELDPVFEEFDGALAQPSGSPKYQEAEKILLQAATDDDEVGVRAVLRGIMSKEDIGIKLKQAGKVLNTKPISGPIKQDTLKARVDLILKDIDTNNRQANVSESEPFYGFWPY